MLTNEQKKILRNLREEWVLVDKTARFKAIQRGEGVRVAVPDDIKDIPAVLLFLVKNSPNVPDIIFSLLYDSFEQLFMKNPKKFLEVIEKNAKDRNNSIKPSKK